MVDLAETLQQQLCEAVDRLDAAQAQRFDTLTVVMAGSQASTISTATAHHHSQPTVPHTHVFNPNPSDSTTCAQQSPVGHVQHAILHQSHPVSDTRPSSTASILNSNPHAPQSMHTEQVVSHTQKQQRRQQGIAPLSRPHKSQEQRIISAQDPNSQAGMSERKRDTVSCKEACGGSLMPLPLMPSSSQKKAPDRSSSPHMPTRQPTPGGEHSEQTKVGQTR